MSSTNFYATPPQGQPFGSQASGFGGAWGMGGSGYTSASQEPLSVSTTLGLQVEWAVQGVLDAVNFQRVLALVQEDSEIRALVVKSAILNALSITSVGVFDWLILPLLDPGNRKWFHRHFEALYQGLWLAPLVALSLFLNLTWCSQIAERTFQIKHGRKAYSASPYSGMVAHIAGSAYRVILIASYLILGFLLEYVPYVGTILSFIYICYVNSYYCFEYLWISRGMTLSQRVKHEEERWAYYFAFGFPSAFLCLWGSSLANAAVFALIFPYFIIQSMHATPVPANPHSPSSSGSGLQSGPMSSQDFSHGVGGPGASPNPLVPVRLPIFAPVIIANDALVRLLSVTGASRATKRSLGLTTLASAEEGGSDLIGGESAASIGLSPINSGKFGYASPIGNGSGGSGARYRVRRTKAD